MPGGRGWQIPLDRRLTPADRGADLGASGCHSPLMRVTHTMVKDGLYITTDHCSHCYKLHFPQHQNNRSASRLLKSAHVGIWKILFNNNGIWVVAQDITFEREYFSQFKLPRDYKGSKIATSWLSLIRKKRNCKSVADVPAKLNLVWSFDIIQIKAKATCDQ